jgi:hypothetical protein
MRRIRLRLPMFTLVLTLSALPALPGAGGSTGQGSGWIRSGLAGSGPAGPGSGGGAGYARS